MSPKKLEDILDEDKNQFGCKAYYLGKLLREGYRVPPGFALPANAGLSSAQLALLCPNTSSFAIRPSSKDEDQFDSSQAGKYTSYLGERDPLSKIALCFSEPSVTSVIIQEMVESEFGGVCFSTSLEGAHLLDIELCLGHNAGVTQGKGVLARVSFQKLDQKIALINDPHALLHQVQMSLLHKLAHQCEQLERAWGFPVDVEWCVRNDELFFLQARPATGLSTTQQIEHIKTLELEKLTQDSNKRGWGLWTDFSIGDMFRNPSRLFLDLVNEDRGERWSVRRIYRDLGLAPATTLPGPLFVSICNRAYIHIGNYYDFLLPRSAFVPGLRKSNRSSVHLQFCRSHSSSFFHSLLHLLRLLFLLPIRFRQIRRHLHLDFDAARLAQLKSEALTIASTNYDEKTLGELWASFDQTIEKLSSQAIYTHLMSDLIAGLSHGIARGCLRFLFGKDADDWEFRLTTGLENNFNSETTLALQRLAQGKITLDCFLRDFGHRGNPDWDLASKRWREEPQKVEVMVQAIRSSSVDYQQQFEAQKAIRVEAEKKLVEHLSASFWRRLASKFVLRQIHYLQIYSPLREQTQSVVFAFIEAVRRIILAIAGKTRMGDSIFELSQEEFYGLRNDHSPEITDKFKLLAGKRKQSAKLANRVHLPHLFDANDLNMEMFTPKKLNEHEIMLKGTKVSRGVTIGKARILDDINDSVTLHADDIVILQFADPSYASVLLSAGGLVLEQGSVYSHTAIIAREFGLPTIVNVAGATQKIKNGQVLRLDADKGVLWICDS